MVTRKTFDCAKPLIVYILSMKMKIFTKRWSDRKCCALIINYAHATTMQRKESTQEAQGGKTNLELNYFISENTGT